MSEHELYQRFTTTLETAAEKVWKRFKEQMPALYFKETDVETQLSHLHLLAAEAASGLEQDLVLRDGENWTFLTGQSRPGQLGDFLRRLPRQRPLISARAYTSNDGHWVIDIFEFGKERSSLVPTLDLDRRFPELSQGLKAEHHDSFKEHLRHCESDYFKAVNAEVAQRHYHLVEQVRGSGNLTITWESNHLRMVVEGSGARRLFERVARYLGRRGIDIERAYVTSFGTDEAPYRYLGFNVSEAHGHTSVDAADPIHDDIRRLHYLSDSVLKLWEDRGDWTLEQCEVFNFLVSLSHQLLNHKDSLRFARARLRETASRYPEVAERVVDGLLGGPPMERSRLDEVDSEAARIFFETCLRIRASLLDWNRKLPFRRSLAARLAPELFSEICEHPPYAVFYSTGRGFEGFHVRFQDVARGGMRLVCPRSSEAHGLEGERLFREAYGLARAQHLKNKDIPEGGAKAVVLVEPKSLASRAGRAFADALLDLTLGEPSDLVYLGPDENVTNELIEWIDERARRRGHPYPSTFMSSKPGAGINHKVYGITSEGVTVFLEAALREAGIEPARDPFTVKITGGPDGDVAGNEMKILLTRYPQTACVVGVADGSGSAEDPLGLDREELLRLVEGVLPIADFDRSKLGPEGRVVALSEPGGVSLRNTLHHRLKADAFIPAGGRPHTIHGLNWEKFLDAEGVPSSPLIVEGANIFLTDEARAQLGARGVTIFKDSSANKCGVICSSFEILASMLLSAEEFLESKERFVAEVIQRLRELALLEAELLLQERRRRPDLTLPELSVRLSQVMLKTAEAVARSINDPLTDNQFGTGEVLLEYLPPLLREKAVSRLDRIPLQYRQRIVACSLAGKIVYREGITYLEDLPQASLQELAITYLAGERSISQLVAQVETSGLPDAQRICQLLELGGARTLTRFSC